MSANLSSVATKSETPLGSLAPRDPDDSLQEEKKRREEKRKSFAPLHDYLNKTLDTIDSLDRDARLEIDRIRQKSHMMYGGSMVLDWDDSLGRWVRADRPEDQIYTVPDYQAHVETALVEIARARTELNVEPVVEDDPAKKELARFCKDRLAFHRERRMNASFSIREALFMILSGSEVRNTYYSTDAGSGVERVPLSERKEVQSPQTRRCIYCNASVPVEGEQCPACGGQSFKDQKADPVAAPVVTSYRRIPYGDVCVESVDPSEINISLYTRRFSDSPYVHRKRLVMRALLESRYDTEIPSTGIKDARLKMERDFAGKAEGSDRREGGEQFEQVEFEQVWLEPSLYHDYVLPDDAELPRGKTLKAGTRLRDKFKKGLYFCRVGKKILDLRDESKDAHWSGIPFRMRPTQSAGGGFEYLIPLQEQKNTLRSLQFIDVHYNSVRREFVNTATGLRAEDLTADPAKAVEVSFDPQNGTFNTAYHQQSGQTSLQHTAPLAQELSGDMQHAAGTFSPVSSAPDIKMMGTATGAAIMREMQTNRYSPALWLRAEQDADQGYQMLELEQRFMPREKLEQLKGKYGERAVKQFMQSDLRCDVRIEPVPGSWMPQTNVQKVANTEAYLMFKANAKREITDEDLALAADAYHVPFQAAEHTLSERRVQEAVERFEAVAKLLEGAGYGPEYAPVVIAQSGYRVDPLLDNPDSLVEEFRDWHLSDAGAKAGPLLRAAVQLAVDACYKAAKERAKYLKQLELEAQEPEADAQLLLQEAQAEQQMQLGAAQAEQQLGAQAAQKQIELEAREQEAEVELGSQVGKAAVEAVRKGEI